LNLSDFEGNVRDVRLHSHHCRSIQIAESQGKVISLRIPPRLPGGVQHATNAETDQGAGLLRSNQLPPVALNRANLSGSIDPKQGVLRR